MRLCDINMLYSMGGVYATMTVLDMQFSVLVNWTTTQASVATHMRPALYWDFMQCRMVIPYRCFR